MKDCAPQEWLRVWAGLYRGYDETEYRGLIEKHKSFSAEDLGESGNGKMALRQSVSGRPT
jgi:hypothetical protein